MRMNLKVPFAEKDEAKKLGARWDAARKLWYVDSPADMAPFSKWSPVPHDGSGAVALSPTGPSARKQQATGKVMVGSDYVERPCICACMPWELCDKCRSTALSG